MNNEASVECVSLNQQTKVSFDLGKAYAKAILHRPLWKAFWKAWLPMMASTVKMASTIYETEVSIDDNIWDKLFFIVVYMLIQHIQSLQIPW